MAEPARRLTAIMFTDLVDYTAIMAADERRAIATVQTTRELIRPRVEAHGGRFLEYEGDGTLSIFSSAVEAASSALEVQRGASDEGIRLHVGVHIGDVIDSGDRVVGDGVNVAARICKLCPPGRVYVSEAVWDQLRNQSGLSAARVGAPGLKNVARPIELWSLREGASPAGAEPAAGRRRRWPLVALGTLAAVALAAYAAADPLEAVAAKLVVGLFPVLSPKLDRKIAFTRSADGTRIAWASVGSAQPVVQVQVWWTNVEYGPLVPAERVTEFLKRHRIVYYDGRGFGLSQRDGIVHSREKQVEDLEAVVAAAGLDRFALWGISGGTPVAIEYAAAHPEKVSKLVLYGTILYKPVDDATYTATHALLRDHFGSTDPLYREFFRSLFFPDATEFETRVFAELSDERVGNGANAAEVWKGLNTLDERSSAARVRVPTLILHRRDDPLIPFRMGVEAAALIPGAVFEPLSGRNHVFLPQDADGARLLDLVEQFVDDR